MKKIAFKKTIAILCSVMMICACLPFAASASMTDLVISDTFDSSSSTVRDGVSTTATTAFQMKEITSEGETDVTSTSFEAASYADGIYTLPVSDASHSYMLKGNASTLPVSMQVQLQMTLSDTGKQNGMLFPIYYDADTDTYYVIGFSMLNATQALQIGYGKITSGTRTWRNVFQDENNAWARIEGVVTGDGKLADVNSTMYLDCDFVYNYVNGSFQSLTFTVDAYLEAARETMLCSLTYTVQASGSVGSFIGYYLGTTVTNAGCTIGVISGSSAVRSKIDSVTFTYQKSDADIAAGFVSAYEDEITAGTATAQNASDILAAKAAYDELSAGVKTILSAYEIDGDTVNVGSVLAALAEAAAPFVPTAACLAFQEYYTENSIASMTALTGNMATIEEALELYDDVEPEQRVAVISQYSKIKSLLNNYFYNNNTITYEAAALSSYPNIASYFTTAFFVNDAEKDGSKKLNSSIVAPVTVTDVTVAYPNDITKLNNGFSFLPHIANFTVDGQTTTGTTDDKFIWTGTRGGNTLGGESGQTAFGFLSKDPGRDAASSGTYRVIYKNDTYLGNASTFLGAWLYGSYFEKFNEGSNVYRLPGDNLVFHYSYVTSTRVDDYGFNTVDMSVTVTAWADVNNNFTFDSAVEHDLAANCKTFSISYRYEGETAPMPYFSTDAASLSNMVYFNAVKTYSLPQEALDAFTAYYEEAGIGAFASAQGNLAALDYALDLYYDLDAACAEEVEEEYGVITDLLNAYFVHNNTVTYNAASLASYPNVAEYFTNTLFTADPDKSAIGYKKLNSDFVDPIAVKTVTVAYPYSTLAGTNGFNFLPALSNVTVDGNTTTGSVPNNFFYTGFRSNKTINGIGGCRAYGLLNDGPARDAAASGTYRLLYKADNNLGNIEHFFVGNTSNDYSLFDQFDDGSEDYRLPGTDIVISYSYTTSTTVDEYGFQTVQMPVTVSAWVESDGNFTFDGEADIDLTNNRAHSVTFTLCYRYEGEDAPEPYFSSNQSSLENMLYFNAVETVDLMSAVYDVSEDFVAEIGDGTSVADFLSNLTADGSVVILDAEDNEVTEGNLATGMRIVVAGNERTIVVTGDVKCDGLLNILDLIVAKKITAGTTVPTDAQIYAAAGTPKSALQASDLAYLSGLLLS